MLIVHRTVLSSLHLWSHSLFTAAVCERGLGAWHRGGLSDQRFCGGGGGRRSGVGFRHAETELSFRQWRENAGYRSPEFGDADWIWGMNLGVGWWQRLCQVLSMAEITEGENVDREVKRSWAETWGTPAWKTRRVVLKTQWGQCVKRWEQFSGVKHQESKKTAWPVHLATLRPLVTLTWCEEFWQNGGGLRLTGVG